MELNAFATKVNALGCLIRGLTLALVAASLAGTALAVDLNQHGLTGTWYDPAISGQGIEIEVYQDAIAPGIGYLQGSWATFAIPWYGYGQRWYTFGGPVYTVYAGKKGGGFNVYENTGGNFNAPPATRGVDIGFVSLTVLDCNTAVMEYDSLALDSASGLWGGTIPLVRLTPNVTCSDDGASHADVDFSYSGYWFDPATSGQGLFIELNPVAEVSFVVWYTYAASGLSGDYGQGWYTGQGKFVPGERALPMTLYETTGGVFGGSSDPAVTVSTQVVGTATATFSDCNTAQWTFNFTSGSNAGQSGTINSNAGASGTINLSRAGPVPRNCGP